MLVTTPLEQDRYVTYIRKSGKEMPLLNCYKITHPLLAEQKGTSAR